MMTPVPKLALLLVFDEDIQGLLHRARESFRLEPFCWSRLDSSTAWLKAAIESKLPLTPLKDGLAELDGVRGGPSCSRAAAQRVGTAFSSGARAVCTAAA